MFDNPKKELERLEQQLLAAEAHEQEEEDFESLYEEIYDEFGREEPYEVDDELKQMLNYSDIPIRNHANNYGNPQQDLSQRSAGFEAEKDYYMDSDRYVPMPKKKGIKGLLVLACIEAVAVIALAAWWLGRLL